MPSPTRLATPRPWLSNEVLNFSGVTSNNLALSKVITETPHKTLSKDQEGTACICGSPSSRSLRLRSACSRALRLRTCSTPASLPLACAMMNKFMASERECSTRGGIRALMETLAMQNVLAHGQLLGVTPPKAVDEYYALHKKERVSINCLRDRRV